MDYLQNRGGGGTVSPSSVELSAGESKTVTVSRVGDGVITAESSDTSVCTVSVNDTTVTITDGGSDGDAVVTIHIAEGTNYYAMSDLTVSVSVTHWSPCTWADGSDAEVEELLAMHYRGEIDIADCWNVGDIRTANNSDKAKFKIAANTYSGTYNKSTTGDYSIPEQSTCKWVILGFKKDSYWDNSAYKTAAVTIQMYGVISTSSNSSQFHPSMVPHGAKFPNNAGYQSTYAYSYGNNTVYNSLGFKDMVKAKTRKGWYSQNTSGLRYENIPVFLLAEYEVFGKNYYNHEEGPYYDYYQTVTNRIKKDGWNGNGSNVGWWLRSRVGQSNGYNTCYVIVNSSGNEAAEPTYNNANISTYPGFSYACCI